MCPKLPFRLRPSFSRLVVGGSSSGGVVEGKITIGHSSPASKIGAYGARDDLGAGQVLKSQQILATRFWLDSGWRLPGSCCAGKTMAPIRRCEQRSRSFTSRRATCLQHRSLLVTPRSRALRPSVPTSRMHAPYPEALRGETNTDASIMRFEESYSREWSVSIRSSPPNDQVATKIDLR